MSIEKKEQAGPLPPSEDSFTRIPEEQKDENGFEEIKDNPRIGVLWYILYTLKMTAILYITKALYHLNPDIEVF